MKPYRELGQVALGSALRQLANQVTKDAEQTYRQFVLNIDPKWFPVFYVLASRESESVVSIAAEIGHSHVSVSKIVAEMKAANLVLKRKSKLDSRVTLLALSAKARKMVPALLQQCEAVDAAANQLVEDTGVDLSQNLKLYARHLRFKSFSQRVTCDAADQLRIVDYSPIHHAAFSKLNTDWITQYWELEEPDLQTIQQPEHYILERGGDILIALYEGEVVGCCALIKMSESDYELAKMAVSPSLKGQGIGERLGDAIIERARQLKAKRIYLESNAILKPAVNLYLKLGFQHIEGASSPYDRCDVQMEKLL